MRAAARYFTRPAIFLMSTESCHAKLFEVDTDMAAVTVRDFMDSAELFANDLKEITHRI